ncbi:MAG TPA: RsmE family RNA methyltransferase [Candidatus Limnocylindrales bacterium]|jgi:16S rRNA (uracil1498-N3)-methyltransferase|nr:RsmE family RNA methyltransferase [Candidatus Limnocylindrales bacterium]
MTRRRWIADEVTHDRAALTGEHAAHLSRTLRARVGQEFEVVCDGQVRHATVASVSDERVEFALGEEIAASVAAPITLLLAVFKFDRMEWAIEKCTELNVTSIVPVIARRTEKHLALAADKRVERWRRIAREASEQSRRVAPPEIGDPVKLPTALETPAELRVVLAEAEKEAQLSEILRGRPELKSLAMAIGPEGGWMPEELQLFETAGWIAASLGDNILRAETAAIAALAVAQAEMC